MLHLEKGIHSKPLLPWKYAFVVFSKHELVQPKAFLYA